MPADLPSPLLLLLHEGGWDELIMVAAGLAIAYVVIMWTGRRSQDDEDLGDDDDDPDGLTAGVESGDPSSTPDDSHPRRP